MRRVAVLIAVLIPVLGLSAQQAPTAEAVLARQLTQSALIRLRTEGSRVTGRLIAVGRGEATLDGAAGRRSIHLNLVDTVWVRGHVTATGAIVGGVTGAIAMGVLASIVARIACEADCEHAGVNGALLGGAAGGISGALLGAAVGALIPKWKRRFP